MVKKIRVVEEDRTEEELNNEEFQAKMLEYMHTMDWKLWEMLKLMKAHLDTETEQPDTNEDSDEDAEEVIIETKTKKKGPRPIIVDEDD